MEICKQQSEIVQREMEICKQQSEMKKGKRRYASSKARLTGGRQIEALWALERAWQIYQSIGIDETNTFQFKIFCLA